MAENKPVDRTKASRLANMLEGLNFPADKPKILSYLKQQLYLNQKVSEQPEKDIIQSLENNLTDNKQYENVYEIEKQAGLVAQGTDKTNIKSNET
jgi:cell division protein FtsL